MDINKKIVILIGDGMADFPLPEFNGKTPLEIADIPNMDYLARNGIFGITRTVPEGMSPGSDTANLSIFGYDPVTYFTGRAPLEALNMNIDLGPNDVAFRCNLVDINNNIMKDYSSGQISTEFSHIVVDELNKKIFSGKIKLFPGVSYRNIMVWRDYPYKDIPQTTPPHDITGKEIFDYLPKGPGADLLIDTMKSSVNTINDSSVINEIKLKKKYIGNPTSAWLWGGGKKPQMETLKERFGLFGYTISAVDLIHGIGRAAGLAPMHVQGATGYIDTDYSGKANALLDAIKKCNFVFLHVEAPDESGHEGNLKHKIKAIEDFDKKIVGPVVEGLKKYPDFTVLIMPDHPTPIKLKTHTADPVPFCIYGSKIFSGFRKSSAETCYTEEMARRAGNIVDKAHQLVQIMINEGV